MASHGDKVTVVIVEDHLALRKGLELLLRDTEFSVIGTADDAEEGQALIERERPAVAIVDIGLPGRSGLELTRRILATDPDFGVLLYTGIGDQDTLVRALDSGARGFALKAGSPEELLTALRAVARGESYVDERLRPLLLARFTTERIGVLSPREREVLDLLAQGLNGEEVAERLVLSPETVRTHVRNAMEKLEASTRVHAVAIALRQGEI
ncbi:MAG: response regulator transcription factor [Actinomycetota bacterium]|nr:response regulator transcription factor [Actinomycetota bacterium]